MNACPVDTWRSAGRCHKDISLDQMRLLLVGQNKSGIRSFLWLPCYTHTRTESGGSEATVSVCGKWTGSDGHCEKVGLGWVRLVRGGMVRGPSGASGRSRGGLQSGPRAALRPESLAVNPLFPRTAPSRGLSGSGDSGSVSCVVSPEAPRSL